MVVNRKYCNRHKTGLTDLPATDPLPITKHVQLTLTAINITHKCAPQMPIQHDIASREIIRRHDYNNGRKYKEPLKKKEKT
jgi:hypothetical protein